MKTALREKIIRYRRECFRVLWKAFRPTILPASELAPPPGQSGAANAYQRVYNELYRRYGISSYKRMPRNCYDQALEWLRGWYEEVEGEGGQL